MAQQLAARGRGIDARDEQAPAAALGEELERILDPRGAARERHDALGPDVPGRRGRGDLVGEAPEADREGEAEAEADERERAEQPIGSAP